MADGDKDTGPGASNKGSEPSFSQFQRAAELLKIKRFSPSATSPSAGAAPAPGAPMADTPAAAAVPAPQAATPSPAHGSTASVPAAALPTAAAAPSPVARAPAPGAAPAAPPPAIPATGGTEPVSTPPGMLSTPSSPLAPRAPAPTPAPPASGAPKRKIVPDLSMAEPVSVAAPPAAVPARAAARIDAPAPARANDNSGGTVPHPEAQAAKALAEPSLPADYAELKRQALAKAQAQMPQESRLALPVGTSLQEYTIEWTLGIGGFGITYLAMDTNLEAEVAIKEYFPSDMCARDSGGKVRIKTPDEVAAFKEGLDKFVKESRTLANFKHPNVVRVSRFFQANDTAYMVMDYESGESFKEWLAQRRNVDEARLLKMIMPLLDGLDVVHKAGFLHRDIKPANIFVREDDSMVLLDFGAARHAVGTRSRSLTTIVTPGYAPFEQYHSHGKQGPWTDLYAFGGLLYWVVTGAKPIEAPARIKNDAMVPASKVGAGRYSPVLLAAIDWALVPDENKRPQSVAELKAALTAPAPVPLPTSQAKPTPASAPKVAVKPVARTDKADKADKADDKTSESKRWWRPW